MAERSERPAPELRVRAGVAILGQQVVVHGLDLHRDCLDMSYVHYLLFCVTGRRLEPRVARVLEQLWIATGYPDARIWCNRIAGYMGSARVDPGLAMSAAIAATNSRGYGFRAMRLAYDVQAALSDDESARAEWLDRTLASGSVLPGYGRPVHGHDERIGYALAALEAAEIGAGPALRRAFWLDRRLRERKGIEMNIAAVWAAMAIDFGIGAEQYEAFMLLMFAPGYMAVYAEQRAKRPFAFLQGYQTPP